MRIAVCTKNDLFGAVVLNHVMPALAGHDLAIFMSVRERSELDDAVPELDLMRMIERQVPLSVLFPVLDDAATKPGQMRTPNQLAATTGRPLTVISDMQAGSGVAAVEAFGAELILSVRFSYLFRRSTIAQASAGIINVHPGPLPQYRGLFTPFWQILRGNEILRCTIHLVDAGVDTGPVLAIREVPVMRSRSLLWHMMQLYLTGAAQAVEFIKHGLPPAVPQDFALAGRTFTPTREEFERFRAMGFSLVKGADYCEFLTPFIGASGAVNSTPFATRLAAVMIAAVLAASALTITLNYFKTRRVLRTQEDLVYTFVANDLASTIEDSMNLGISLAMLQTTEQLIQRRRAAESGTLGISVFDATGNVLFDTDQFRLGRRLPPDWAPPYAQAPEWRAEAPFAYIVGGRITNSFGQPAGGVIVRYDKVSLETRVYAVLLDMVRAGLLALAVTAGITAIAAPLLTRQLRRWLSRASADVARAHLAPAGTGAMSPVTAAVAEASQELAEAEDALMRLGMAEAEQPLAA